MKNLILLILLTLTPAFGLNVVDKAQFPATNYITNGGAEQGRSGFARYADAAGSSPVDGTAGSPNASTTLTTTTSSPIAGVASLLFSKDAVNRQGEGFSYDFSIDRRDQAKVLAITFDYEVSANFVGGASADMQVWVYDKTNAVLIQPTTYLIEGTSASGPHKFLANFQTASNSTSYRLIWHVATTSALAYTFKVDSIYVSREPRTLGVAVTDWQTYTPTFTGFGTVANISFFSRRVGDSLEILGKATTGTTTAVEGRISLGFQGGNSNVTVDSTKLASIRNVGTFVLGTTSSTVTKAVLAEPSVSYLTFGINVTTTAELTKVQGTTFGNTVDFSLFASVPIAGWSSSVVLGSDADTRVTAMTASGTPANTAASAPIIFPTVVKDSHSAYSTVTGQYTAPTSGWYWVSTFYATTSGGSTGKIAVYVNNVSYQTIGGYYATTNFGTASGVCYANAGQTIDVRMDQTGTGFGGTNSLSIQRISGPSAIAASETVSARYAASSSTITSSLATIIYNTLDHDSHLSYSTGNGKYTAPISGRYQVNAAAITGGTIALNTLVNMQFLINGATAKTRSLVYAGGAQTGIYTTLSDILRMNAGDTLEIQLSSTATSPVITANSLANYFSIVRVGNY